MRIDKWLWVARFFKTRSLAAQAVDGGKVKLNGTVPKPARELKLGDHVHLCAGEQDYEIVVRAFNEQRRPAPEARLLYEESPESVARRAELAELRRLAPTPGSEAGARPTKRDRRALGKWRGE